MNARDVVSPPPDGPFARFADPAPFGGPLRDAIASAHREPEPAAVARLLPAARMPADVAARAGRLARRLAGELRARGASGGRAGRVQALLQEYSLSSHEGVALMCLAEALLRIPDAATRDALIRDKIAPGRWEAHLGRSPSLFVNAATWGLMLTGRLVAPSADAGLSAALARAVGRGGEPLVRAAVDRAMRTMGEQFVTGETIDEALANAAPRERQGFRHSFDMLGEAALTADDALRYRRAYETAIEAIGRASGGRGPIDGPGISVKLSALHPRYARAQQRRVHDELYPVLLGLCARARRHDIGLNVDAEEADRLELSLDLLERLCAEPALAGWDGLGFVIQAYQKRCPAVVGWIVDLARRTRRRLMVRLVKGAYWDAEIKRAQVDGLDDYPVFTRKPHTDASYLACARVLLAAPDAVFPQFATHNAHTLAAIHALAGDDRFQPAQYEFQCLHGMGEPLYERVVAPAADGGLGRPCRIYAPVGSHETLLAYLVRRLLENGANTSFVNRIADEDVPLDALVRDPVATIDEATAREGAVGLPHPAIPLPRDLLRPARVNSRGPDLSDANELARLGASLRAGAAALGPVADATDAEVDRAVLDALRAAPGWASTPVAHRAAMLEAAADRLEAQPERDALIGLLVREAGKTVGDAVAEVREAIDFLRYYAAEARGALDGGDVAPLGPVVCISPWNFPLAIFVGQVAAALAAGNPVLAKPAEQTPRIAARAVRALLDAGVPEGVLQLVPGDGARTGARLVADPRVRGVLFTGSTEVARRLQATLAERVDDHGRAIPLVAETGGQNAMIVDSSALPEQVVADAIASAFGSAGQRCSALRVLCVQHELADGLLRMLLGAMAELRVGPPDRLSTDVGPVIDAEARAGIVRHVDAMRARGRRVHELALPDAATLGDRPFVPPTLIEIDDVAELDREVFGPVLHLVRYRREDLDGLVARIGGSGYGLTLGLHTRIDATVERVVAAARAGNVYVNRNMVGAVVGVQPFGGEGLSGTGPKAGGPLYLYRLLSRRPADVVARVVPAAARDADRAPGGSAVPASARDALAALLDWGGTRTPALRLPPAIERSLRAAPIGVERELPGPTGERNVWRLVPRDAVACLAAGDADRFAQLAAVLAVGSRAIVPHDWAAFLAALPAPAAGRIGLVADPLAAGLPVEAVLLHGSAERLIGVQRALAARPGPVVAAERLDPGDAAVPLERLAKERTVTVNTAAAGGNATLMTQA